MDFNSIQLVLASYLVETFLILAHALKLKIIIS